MLFNFLVIMARFLRPILHNITDEGYFMRQFNIFLELVFLSAATTTFIISVLLAAQETGSIYSRSDVEIYDPTTCNSSLSITAHTDGSAPAAVG